MGLPPTLGEADMTPIKNPRPPTKTLLRPPISKGFGIIKKSTMTDKISTHLDIKPIGKEPCPKKEINQENCQLSTVIVDGVKYTNVPEKTRKEIEKIAKMYGKIRK